ncbi:MAG: arylesterase [Verrucomicrobiota bacterium]
MNCYKPTILLLFLGLLPVWSSAAEKRLLILGDSLTKGYGLDPEASYPALLQDKLEANTPGEWRVLNGGVSGDTTAGGLRRAPWLLKKPVDLLIIALGGNDGLRGIDPSESEKNLQAIIDAAKASNPETQIVIAGMQMPDNMGKDYVSRFKALFPMIAEKNKLVLIPFLLEGVAGDPELNLPDYIHPNEDGQKIIAETVWAAIQPLLQGAAS